MVFAVGPHAAEAGHRVVEYDRLDSTNTEAMRLARGGEGGPLWVVTREQTAGRGRRGREWISAPGNLAASFLYRAAIQPAVAATLGFAASVAVVRTCRVLAPGIAFAVKWPNDVLADGKKIAGILLESEAQHQAFAIVMGCGINIAQAPQGSMTTGMTFPATSFVEFGTHVTPAEAFAALSENWAGLLDTWNDGEGFATIRDLWLEAAHGLGKPISVRVGDSTQTGTFETLDDHGRLMLRTASGTLQAVSAGDVFFGDAASAQPGAPRHLVPGGAN